MSAAERSTRLGAMADRSWLLLLVLAAAGVLQVRSQRGPDTTGFISIDCGLSEPSEYVDELTKLQHTSDAGFTDAGTNYDISEKYVDPSLSKRYPQMLNVRSFPGGAHSRSCYTLPSAGAGTTKYLVRASFLYGNYDGLNKSPVFDLHLGVNFWQTVNISDAGKVHAKEVIAFIPDESVQVCLVNTGLGTPFISSLDLRPLKGNLYPQVNATQALVLLARVNFGATETIRYPDDPYDRVWMTWSVPALWQDISTTDKMVPDMLGLNGPDLFEVPSIVMQTAIAPLNVSQNIHFAFDAEPNDVYPKPDFTSVLYFAELKLLDINVSRVVIVLLNNDIWIPSYKPIYLSANSFYSGQPLRSFTRYNFTIAALKPDSTLPPIVNAGEFFSIIYPVNVGTDAEDVSAIIAIKAKYQVKKNWEGDPCAPTNFAWDGIKCIYPDSRPPTITSINMSVSGLSGDISPYFASLKSVKYLDLSHNNLTGLVPDVLSEVSSLVVIDLTGNNINGPFPSGLLKRIQDGSLTVKYGDNPNLCSFSSSCQPTPTKRKLSSLTAVYIAVPLAAVVMIIGLVFFIMSKKQGSAVSDLVSRSQNSNRHSVLQLDNRRFTYRELEVITDNFQRVLGRGGFGSVYDGVLEDGTKVAVKLRSYSSNQGVREFLTEARILAKIHHKNLVSLIGYCMDREYLALVYEHMSGGNLEDKLRGIDSNHAFLTWRQRLRIALESAQGLEYLHKSCSPPFVHRDVKTSNVLLDANLKAKVADFGLLKAFSHDNATHVSTDRVVGTRGYLDPEYAAALHLTEKSDVYSFGILLLEVISGQPPILQCPELTNIVQWVRHRLAQGDIDGVVDAHMREGYDVNGIWKSADLALRCAAQDPAERPTITAVVAELQECLELEESRTGGDSFYTGNSSMYATDDQSTDVAESSAPLETLQMGHNFGRASTMAAGPATR